jgi:hypothetical protein
MMQTLIAAIMLFLTSFTRHPSVLGAMITATAPHEVVLGSREFSLGDRYHVPSVNEVMKKNILLNLAYLDGTVTKNQDINWNTVENPADYSFTLNPGQVFAFHDDVLPQYQGKVVVTTKAHFDSTEGFVSDGYLFGDGVCHFASLINWAAEDAGLTVQVTKNHNFATIAEVPKQYGVSIYTQAGVKGSGEHNNLYITNNQTVPVTFHFTVKDNALRVFVTKSA